MAIVYIDSNAADGANDGTSWALAYRSVTGTAGTPQHGVGTLSASNEYRIAQNHNETAAIGSAGTRTVTFPTTPGCRLICVNSGTEALATGAVIDAGAANAATNIASGYAYVYGVTFTGGTNVNTSCDIVIGSGNTAALSVVLYSCTLQMGSTSTSANLFLGSSIGGSTVLTIITLIDCSYIGASSAAILVRTGKIYIRNLSVSGTAPTTLFDPAGGGEKLLDLTVEASNLSGFAYTNLISAAGSRAGTALFRQCKLANTTITTGSFVGPGSYKVILADCDDGDEHYHYREERWEGSISTSNAIYQSAGDGTNSFSLLMTGNANTNFVHPLVSPEISAFNSTLSSMTTLVEVTNDGTTYDNDELWQETMAKVTSGVPLGTWNIADRVADILATPAAQASSSVSWTGTGGFSAEVKQKLESGSFTPAEVGEIATIVKLAKNDNVYVSPKIFSTSAKQWLSGSGSFINERASDGGGGAGIAVLTGGGLAR